MTRPAIRRIQQQPACPRPWLFYKSRLVPPWRGPFASCHSGTTSAASMVRKESIMGKTVKELMHKKVETVTPEDTVKHAAVVMEACEIGPLPVCDGQKMVGIVTDRDITVRAVAAGRDPNTTRVREVMTAETIATCRPEQSVDEAVELMREHEVRRLPVVDDGKRLVGIVALADLAQHTGARTSGEAVQAVSRPTETQQT